MEAGRCRVLGLGYRVELGGRFRVQGLGLEGVER